MSDLEWARVGQADGKGRRGSGPDGKKGFIPSSVAAPQPRCAQVDVKDRWGNEPLQEAILNGHREVVAVLSKVRLGRGRGERGGGGGGKMSADGGG